MNIRKIPMIVAASALVLGCLSVLAYAQPPLEFMEVHVPFSFTVDRTTLPAGTYVVEPLDSSEAGPMLLQTPDGKYGVEFLTEAMDTNSPTHESELVFDKVGDRNFLSQIWSSSLEEGRVLVKSSAETRLEKAGQQHEQRTVKARPAKKSMYGAWKS